MSPLAQLIFFFVLLCVLVLVVYFLVVKAFYWGDKKDAHLQKKTKKPDE
jgi:hypothetical protein